jgi:hypothetical protein
VFSRVVTFRMKEREYFPIGIALLFHLNKRGFVGIEGGRGCSGERHFCQVRGHVIPTVREVDEGGRRQGILKC